jgi:hypothetical protein
VEVSPCAGLEAGTLLARGRGFRSNTDDEVGWFGLRTGVRAYLPLGGPVDLGLGGGAAVGLLRPRVRFRSNDGSFNDLHSPGEVSARFSVTLRYRLW